MDKNQFCKLIKNLDVSLICSGESNNYLKPPYTETGVFCNTSVLCDQYCKFKKKIWIIGGILNNSGRWTDWYKYYDNLIDKPDLIIVTSPNNLDFNENIVLDSEIKLTYDIKQNNRRKAEFRKKFNEFNEYILKKNNFTKFILYVYPPLINSKLYGESTGIIALRLLLELDPKSISICGLDSINNETKYNESCSYENLKNREIKVKDQTKEHLEKDIVFFKTHINNQKLKPIKECGLFKWIEKYKKN